MTHPKVVKIAITIRYPSNREVVETLEFDPADEPCLGILWTSIDGNGNLARENGADVVAAFYDRIAENKGPAWARPRPISQSESTRLRDGFGPAIDKALLDANGQNRPWSGDLVRTLYTNLASAKTPGSTLQAQNTMASLDQPNSEPKMFALAKRATCNVNVYAWTEPPMIGGSSKG